MSGTGHVHVYRHSCGHSRGLGSHLLTLIPPYTTLNSVLPCAHISQRHATLFWLGSVVCTDSHYRAALPAGEA